MTLPYESDRVKMYKIVLDTDTNNYTVTVLKITHPIWSKKDIPTFLTGIPDYCFRKCMALDLQK